MTSSVTRGPDVIVVGGGIVGAACAWELARAGVRVRVVEAGFVGGGATAAGMGHIVVMDDSEAQFALSAYSARLWAELAPELPAAAEVDPCGTLWLAEDDAQMAAVVAKRAYYTARGVEAEALDGAKLARLEPELRRGLAGALRVPGDLVVYPPAVARWLVERARELGAEVWEGRAVEQVEERAVWVRTGRGWGSRPGGSGSGGSAGGESAVGGGLERIEADAVIVAAGASAAGLVPGLSIVPRKGHLAITDRYPGFCRHQLVELGYLDSAHSPTGESVAFNLQPRRTGQLLIGSSRELVGWDESTNRDVLGRMLRRATEFLPGLASLSVIRTWTGFRPAAPDSLPLIGEWPELEGVWLAAGHEGLGITTSLGTARILATLIVGGEPETDPAPYSPARVLSAAGTGPTADTDRG